MRVAATLWLEETQTVGHRQSRKGDGDIPAPTLLQHCMQQEAAQGKPPQSSFPTEAYLAPGQALILR